MGREREVWLVGNNDESQEEGSEGLVNKGHNSAVNGLPD